MNEMMKEYFKVSFIELLEREVLNVFEEEEQEKLFRRGCNFKIFQNIVVKDSQQRLVDIFTNFFYSIQRNRIDVLE